MKVLMNAISARRGGIVTYTRNLSRSMQAQEIDAIIAAPQETAIQLAGKSLCVDSSTLSPVQRLVWEQHTWRRIVAQHSPDVLFSSANFALLGCRVPQLLLMREGGLFNPYYLRHVYPGLGRNVQLETRLRRAVMLRSIRAADRVMFPSETLRDWIAQWVPRLHEKGIVNPYGIDLHQFRPNPHAPPEAGATLRLLYVSVYYPHKDPQTLLGAVRLLREAGVDVRARITMAKPEFDPWPPGQAVYRDLTGAERDGLIELGPVPYGELPATYAEHDIFVFPSASETFGFPLVEAMASGLPVIASDTLTNREICGPAALYYRPFDAGALAERVRELRDRPDLYRWLGEEGVKRARARFDVTQHFDRLLGILDRMQANGTARVQ